MMYIYLIINILLYFFLFWRQKKRLGFNHYVLLITLYLFVSICCLFFFDFVKKGGGSHDFLFSDRNVVLTLWPFIYIFLCFYLLSSPYRKRKPDFYDDYKYTKVIASLFVFCSFFYFLIFSSKILSNITSGDWANVYNDFYLDRQTYSNLFEHIVMLLCMYLKIPALVIFFYYLTTKDCSYIFKALLLFSLLLFSASRMIVSASRSFMFMDIISFVAVYLFFKPQIDKKLIKKINAVILAIVSSILLLVFLVTSSRWGQFGEDAVWGSFLYYFGHSFLVFNYGIVDTIKSFGNGLFFLNGLPGLPPPPTEAMQGTHFEPMFPTMIGVMYRDFGPIFTILISFLFPKILEFFYKINKNRLDLAEIMIYFYFFIDLAVGVFYLNSSILNWIILSGLFILLKFSKSIFISSRKI